MSNPRKPVHRAFLALAAVSCRSTKSGYLKPAIFSRPFIFSLARLSRLSCVQFPSTHAPADDRRFDWAAGIHTMPSTATPSAQKRNDIGADVIFAKKFKWLVYRRNTLVSKGVDSLCRVAMRFQLSPIVIIRCAHGAATASRRAYISLTSA
jgi:hypothetical protein